MHLNTEEREGANRLSLQLDGCRRADENCIGLLDYEREIRTCWMGKCQRFAGLQSRANRSAPRCPNRGLYVCVG